MDPRLRTPALRGDLAAVNRALDEGADPNLADADGYNPLIFAAINNRVDCVARLIEAGSRPDCHTFEGLTPLNLAARYGHLDLIRVLLAGGAQVDFCPPHEHPPLYYAIEIRHNFPGLPRTATTAAVRALLEAGADPNPEQPVLSSAVFLGRPILQLLLRAGANVEAALMEFETVDGLDEDHAEQVYYLRAVHAAGGFPAYARAHRSLFVGILSRCTRLPAVIIPKIIEYWVHLGWYPGTAREIPAALRRNPYRYPYVGS